MITPPGSEHGATTSKPAEGISGPQLTARDLAKVGLLEWLRPGNYEQAERTLADLAELGVCRLRSAISWADWHIEANRQWYDWLLPKLARQVEFLPCFHYTPPSLGIAPKVCSPPREPKGFADFLDVILTRYGHCFEWVELWNEPNNVSEWDWSLDANGEVFCRMVGGAAYWARRRGKKTLLGGMSPVDPNWLSLVFSHGVMQYIDAVGIHGFPVTFDATWPGWPTQVSRVQEVLDRHNHAAEIWISETGYSTAGHNQRRQYRDFLLAAQAPVERAYWYSLYDLDPAAATIDGFHVNENEYHFGIKHFDGRPKLLYRLWQGGLDRLRSFSSISEPLRPDLGRGRQWNRKPVMITGGAGFIGTNLADRLLRDGRTVLIYDNLSRPGVERNIDWLRETHGDRVRVELGDVRDPLALARCVPMADEVYHLAAQVAVTTSLLSPLDDFAVNAEGTIRLLEAVRRCSQPPSLVFTSTNKVYGALDDVELELHGQRYQPSEPAIRAAGIDESRPLDFHSPYGCSKGSADQYVLDYSRSFGLRTLVFRMSCIYGPHQMGTEDQGWVAHFLIRALDGQPLVIYGNGKQVRDVLFVEDLVEAFVRAQRNIGRLAGAAFNIGGGPGNTVSLLELLDMIERLHGQRPEISFENWRTGDQRYYVSNTSAFSQATGWQQTVTAAGGVERLYRWLLHSRPVPAPVPRATSRRAAVPRPGLVAPPV